MNTLLSPVLSPMQPNQQGASVSALPYVVSADIKVLLCQWASRRGFVLPDDSFFTDLRAEFRCLMRNVFSQFIWVSEEEIIEGLRKRTASVKYPLLSLERAYLETQFKLELCRCVNAQNADVGLYARNGASLLTQLATLHRSGIKRVVLVDDVIFSGSFLIRILELLKKEGVKVSAVYTGIAVGSGMAMIQSHGYYVECVRFFPEVIDEICERDFFPGVPLSGRTLHEAQNVGIPYILPFGLMGKWASVPEERGKVVSERCIEFTALLFDQIGRVSGRPVRCSDLDRGVLGIPSSATPFVDALKQFVG